MFLCPRLGPGCRERYKRRSLNTRRVTADPLGLTWFITNTSTPSQSQLGRREETTNTSTMSIPELSQLGEFLVGRKTVAEQPAWLQSVLSSVSPLGSFLALAAGSRLVLLQAKFSGGNKQFLPVFQVRPL